MGERTVLRWQRRYGGQRFVFALFSEFTVGDMLPGTIVYQRLVLAIALQRLWHALRPDLYRVSRYLRKPAPASEPPQQREGE